jgi:hypothetical protein
MDNTFEHCKPGVAYRLRIAAFVIGILLGIPTFKEAKVAESLNVCVTVGGVLADVTLKETAVIDCKPDDIDIL